MEFVSPLVRQAMTLKWFWKHGQYLDVSSEVNEPDDQTKMWRLSTVLFVSTDYH